MGSINTESTLGRLFFITCMRSDASVSVAGHIGLLITMSLDWTLNHKSKMCINWQSVSMEDHHINEVHSQNQSKFVYDKNRYFLVQGRVLEKTKILSFTGARELSWPE